MKPHRVIGQTPKGQAISLNVPVLLKTRLLVQANSGGGKSYLLRKILEATHGDIQQIVLDMEGEFSTLREKFDYVLVGKDGDIDISLKIASLLPRKLLELDTSAIIDLYELKHHERIQFVKRFLDAMVNAPKSLWKPCMVVLDEAHVFAPEKSKSESLSAVVDIVTRGRKRGYSTILATQRISKLHKDVCAEMINKIIGRTGLDIDMKRAADELGFRTKEQMLGLRDLSPGEFFAFGPAISTKIVRMKVDKVSTSHPEAGEYQIERPLPPPKKRIKSVLEKLQDLPQAAEDELRTVQDLQRKVRELQREVKLKPKPEVDEKAIEQAEYRGGETVRFESLKIIGTLETEKDRLEKAIREVTRIATCAIKEAPPSGQSLAPLKPLPSRPESRPYQETAASQDKESINTPLRAGAMKMLKAVVMFHPRSITKQQMGTLAGFSIKGGTFQTYLSDLKKNQWITVDGNKRFAATEAGIESAGSVDPLPIDPDEIVEMWADKFRAGAARMLRTLASEYPISITKEHLALRTDFTVSGGTFQTYLSELRRNGLIIVEGSMVSASPELFMEG